jgi:hypothetical protein
MNFLSRTLALTFLGFSGILPAQEASKDELLLLDNGTVKIGINRAKGAAITWLSWATYPKNMVNSHDPGRLIQQSYYAGKSLDRRPEGQHAAWSPWTWNPIQGGGVGSWAKVTAFSLIDKTTLHSETVPKLWDMPDEEAAATMRQWTGFEKDMPDVILVRCELIARREADDRWGTTPQSPQEVPACYFTRNFSIFRTYLGEGNWREEPCKPGPPWSQARPPLRAMACFSANGQGVAVFSPAAEAWNFGPHADGQSDDPLAGPCVHIAPVTLAKLGPRSTFNYRYWLIVGTKESMAIRLDSLWEKYRDERPQITD